MDSFFKSKVSSILKEIGLGVAAVVVVVVVAVFSNQSPCKYPNVVTVVVDNGKVYNLPIEYNWRPQKCVVYDTFGHTVARCSKNKKNKGLAVWLLKDGNTGEKIVDSQNVNTVNTIEEVMGERLIMHATAKKVIV